MTSVDIDQIIREIEDNYGAEEIFFTKPDRHFPNRDAIISIIKDLRQVMFPRYFGDDTLPLRGPSYFIGNKLIAIEETLAKQVYEALAFRDSGTRSDEEIRAEATDISSQFIARIPELQKMLLKDVQAAFDGDPAAQSKEEIIFSYPGFFAIYVYRLAHELYVHNVPLIPRIMTEYAHSKTGVDINAGATIGEYFFIDHATGVVIGETTIIGDHVKVYQGVTLGALSTRAGQALSGVKRHPTIEDNVTIYSNASVLGGETVVGEGSIIAGSAFVIKSVPKNSRVSLKNQEVNVRESAPKKTEPPAPTWEI